MLVNKFNCWKSMTFHSFKKKRIQSMRVCIANIKWFYHGAVCSRPSYEGVVSSQRRTRGLGWRERRSRCVAAIVDTALAARRFWRCPPDAVLPNAATRRPGVPLRLRRAPTRTLGLVVGLGSVLLRQTAVLGAGPPARHRELLFENRTYAVRP